MVTAQIVASVDEIFQLLEDGSIRRFTGTSDNPRHWTELDACSDVDGIAAGDNLYKLHSDGQIFVYDHGNWDQIYSKDNSDFLKDTVKIVAAGATMYQVQTIRSQGFTHRVLCYNGRGRGWDEVARNVTDIAADGDLQYTRSTNGEVSRRDGYVARIDNNRNTAEIVVGDGYLYQRHHDGQVYRYFKGFWDRLDSGNATVQIAAGSAGLYRRDSNGQVWMHIGSSVWRLIDKSHDNSDIVVAKWLYALMTDDGIYRYTGSSWEQLQ